MKVFLKYHYDYDNKYRIKYMLPNLRKVLEKPKLDTFAEC